MKSVRMPHWIESLSLPIGAKLSSLRITQRDGEKKCARAVQAIPAMLTQ
jgi:hypothetical protein